MRQIYLLRHAKSSWDDFSLQDFDRPLTDRGIKDAGLMGKFFQTRNIKLDVVISSPSKRRGRLRQVWPVSAEASMIQD